MSRTELGSKVPTVALGSSIIVLLILFLYFVSSEVFTLCGLVALAAACYFLFSLVFRKSTEDHAGKSHLSVLLLLVIFLPVFIGLALALFSEFSLLLVVFLTGLTMVFFYDFLITLKIGKGVQASSDAKAFTTAPESWKDLYLQRLRWYRGTSRLFLNIEMFLIIQDLGICIS